MPIAVALLLAAIGPAPIRFKITHHVHLENGVLSTYDVRRDGSLVGSYGQMGLHDGFEFPLVIKKGRQVVISNERDFNSHQVAAFLPNHRFVVLHDDKEPRTAMLSGRKLVLGASVSLPRPSPEVKPVKCQPSAEINKAFPVPEGMRDTTANESVETYKYLIDTKLVQVNISWHMEYAFRSGLVDSSGRIRSLEKCIPELGTYQVCGIQFVSPDGWFVVDAIKAPPAHDDGLRIGFGEDLFWVEPVRFSHASKL